VAYAFKCDWLAEYFLTPTPDHTTEATRYEGGLLSRLSRFANLVADDDLRGPREGEGGIGGYDTVGRGRHPLSCCIVNPDSYNEDMELVMPVLWSVVF
jgi:hypothetical protein